MLLPKSYFPIFWHQFFLQFSLHAMNISCFISIYAEFTEHVKIKIDECCLNNERQSSQHNLSVLDAITSIKHFVSSQMSDVSVGRSLINVNMPKRLKLCC